MTLLAGEQWQLMVAAVDGGVWHGVGVSRGDVVKQKLALLAALASVLTRPDCCMLKPRSPRLPACMQSTPEFTDRTQLYVRAL